ncbi:MAG: NigD-like protein [Tannerellaceae bacterium]|nr:NigD-like protein [Tannerellaceae bacterium]
MRKIIFLFLPLFVLIACDNDDDSYSLNNFRVDIATVENPNNDAYFYLVRDNGVRLWVAATNYPAYKPESGQRVLADYTLLSDRPEGSGYDHDVKLNSAYNILTKDIVELTPANEATLGDDPIGIRELWIGSDYLNIRFYYGGYNKTHYINLALDETKVYSDGKVHLELRHNDNGDANTYRYNGFVSFRLRSLLEDMVITTSSVDLVIHVREYDDEDKVYNVTYKFNDENHSSVDFDRDDYSENEQNNVE